VAYNESILDAERSVARFVDAGRTGVILRFASFYGPDSRFLIEAIRQAEQNGRAFVPGAGDAYFSSVSHDDAATAAAAALEVPSGVYNVVDDEPVTRREYFDALSKALGIPPLRLLPWWARYLLGSLGELLTRSQRISNRKLKSASPWQPKYPSVREGWPAVIAEMRESGVAAN
jgi:nucleoside-diphosphate-sugar epimerase